MQILESGNKLVIDLPINMHAHFRQGKFLEFLVGVFIQNGWRGVVQAMPNPEPPILTGDDALSYHNLIMEVARKYPYSQDFIPAVSIQITPKTTISVLYDALEKGTWLFKVYPFQVTNNSDLGVEDYRAIIPCLRFLEGRVVKCRDGRIRRVTVQFHPESPGRNVIGRLKESHFIDYELQQVLDATPSLRVSLEHISTEHAVRFLEKHGWDGKNQSGIVATVPIQYMTTTVDSITGYDPRFNFKVCADNGCKPVPKDPSDVEALIGLATSGKPYALAGNDDACHLLSTKRAQLSNCGTANTWASLPLTLCVFEQQGKFDNLEQFLTHNASRFHNLPTGTGKLTFVREDWIVPNNIPVPGTNDSVCPWMAGQEMKWKLVS